MFDPEFKEKKPVRQQVVENIAVPKPLPVILLDETTKVKYYFRNSSSFRAQFGYGQKDGRPVLTDRARYEALDAAQKYAVDEAVKEWESGLPPKDDFF